MKEVIITLRVIGKRYAKIQRRCNCLEEDRYLFKASVFNHIIAKKNEEIRQIIADNTYESVTNQQY